MRNKTYESGRKRKRRFEDGLRLEKIGKWKEDERVMKDNDEESKEEKEENDERNYKTDMQITPGLLDKLGVSE